MIGGLENYVFNLCKEQINLGYDVNVITLNRNFTNNQLLPSEEIVSGIRVLRIPYFGSSKYPLAFSIIRYLKAYDIIHVHAVDFFADFISLTKLWHKKKIILTTHGGFFHTKKYGFLKKIYFNTITRFSIRNYNKIIACSTNDYNTFSKISSKISLINNGVNVEMYIKTPKHAEKGTLLTVGRLDTHKQINKLLEALKILKDKGYEMKLKIAGPDSRNLKPVLVNLAKDLGIESNVLFVGTVSEAQLIDLFSQAYLFLSASAYEGFGIAAVEALSSGTPCILNDIPSFSEIIQHNEFGSLVNFNTAQDAASKIETFLSLNEMKYNQISNEARKFAESYSWQKVARKIIEVY
jgi:alpha-1,3-mannosyltransferase